MRQIYFYILLTTIAVSCREVYEPPFTGPSKGFLVVEGVINTGLGPTTFHLSRAVALADSNKTQLEQFAQVRVEGEDNSSFFLYEIDKGVYSVDQLTLNPNVKYRIHIYTIDKKEYISDYSENKNSPPIDDITWERQPNGVQLFINTHDPQENTHYYRWEFEETWLFHSTYLSNLKYLRRIDGTVYAVDFKTPGEVQGAYTCWANESSKTILIGSSVRLSRDTIHLPIEFIPQDSWKISVKYSINVKQYAPSIAGYEYLQRMKKNTEQVGSLFDSQPSELIGNIHCLQDANEPVVGFVDVAQVVTKRIFIDVDEVRPWHYDQGCAAEVSIRNNPDSLDAVRYDYLPTTVHTYDLLGFPLRFWMAQPVCVDCTLRGTNAKPPYWP